MQRLAYGGLCAHLRVAGGAVALLQLCCCHTATWCCASETQHTPYHLVTFAAHTLPLLRRQGLNVHGGRLGWGQQAARAGDACFKLINGSVTLNSHPDPGVREAISEHTNY